MYYFAFLSASHLALQWLKRAWTRLHVVMKSRGMYECSFDLLIVANRPTYFALAICALMIDQPV